jgi:hypothetical protein
MFQRNYQSKLWFVYIIKIEKSKVICSISSNNCSDELCQRLDGGSQLTTNKNTCWNIELVRNLGKLSSLKNSNCACIPKLVLLFLFENNENNDSLFVSLWFNGQCLKDSII